MQPRIKNTNEGLLHEKNKSVQRNMLLIANHKP